MSGITQQFTIAGVTLAVSCNTPLTVDSRWGRFRAAVNAVPEHLFLIHRYAPLAKPQSNLRDCGSGRLLQRSAEGETRYYTRQPGGGVYAVTDTAYCEPHISRIAADLCRAPWGEALRDYFPQLCLPHLLVQRERLILHGAYIRCKGSAIVFTAPSGTGKTTQAELWKRLGGAQIVNGDRVALREQGGAVYACGLPVSGSSPDCENVESALAAIVSLEQAQDNRICRCTQWQAVQVLLNGSSYPAEYPDDLPATVNAAIRLAACVPIYRLSCLPDAGAVELLARTLQISLS